jgi:hypothetical protein
MNLAISSDRSKLNIFSTSTAVRTFFYLEAVVLIADYPRFLASKGKIDLGN